MNKQEFREFAIASVDYIIDYFDKIRDRPVLPSVKPGYLKDFIPDEPPQFGECWQDVLQDVDRLIMPGITHWQSPNFHAYFPAGVSFPSLVAEILSAGLGCVGMNWVTSPVFTELEVAMMNWLGKLINLPPEFLNSCDGSGGGIIQRTASEVTLIGLLAAREKMVKYVMKTDSNLTEDEVKAKLVAYTSEQAHSSVEKAARLGSMRVRHLLSDENGALRGHPLLQAIQEDRDKGLIPCYVVGTLGTTSTCAFDNLEELGLICNAENIWFHVDAAYAGTACICPEYQYLMKGVELADSFCFNPHKWMLVHFDCSAMWVKEAKYIVELLRVERVYLNDRHQGLLPEYVHWELGLGRPFRALKLWFVLRIYGVEYIQKYIRRHIALAQYFEHLVKSDNKFEFCSSSMGRVCFRLKGDDNINQVLIERLTERKKIFILATHFKHKTYISCTVCSTFTTEKDLNFSWEEITTQAAALLTEVNNNIEEKGENLSTTKIVETCERNENNIKLVI